MTILLNPVRVEFSTPLQAELQPSFAGDDNGTNTQFVDASSCEVDYGVIDQEDYCPPSDGGTTPLGELFFGDRLLGPGIGVVTCGTIENLSAGDRYVVGLVDFRNVTTSATRPEVNPAVFHHPDWTVDKLGNVFGTDFDKAGNVYVTASSHYSNIFGYDLGGTTPQNLAVAVINYGSIGGGAQDLGAAGTIYKLDALTGAPVVFAQLPQQATTFTHLSCEDDTDPSLTRTTGPGLGNIVFDKVHEQFFVSNFEDGSIYRIDAAGTVLSVFDPQTLAGFAPDDNSAGWAPDAKPYGLTIDPSGERLFFGTHNLNTTPAVYSVSLDETGEFLGTEALHQVIMADGDIGFQFAIEPGWVAISDLEFNPDGQLVVALRSGCAGEYPTSHNHGATYYLVSDLNSDGLFAETPDQIRIRYRNDETGNDDGYGGIGIWNKYDGTFDYVVSSSDLRSEVGPHGMLVFPNDFTDAGNGTTNYFLQPSAAVPYLPSFNVNDFKGIGGDIALSSACGDPLPIQIGNFVWLEAGTPDGIQQACEEPVEGLPVALYTKDDNGDLTLVATTMTDEDGEYYFTGDGTTGETWPNGGVVIRDTTYLIVFGNTPTSATTFTANGTEYAVTQENTGQGNNPDLNDSDAVFTDVNGMNLPAICYSTADTTDHTLDIGLVPTSVFDLALVKRIDASTPGPYIPGSTVTFGITVYNQGDTDATDIEVKDYLPEGLSLAPASAPNWTISMDTAILTTPIDLIAGAETTLLISLVIDADFMGDMLTNRAEISSFDDDNDPNTPPPVDEDSTPNDNGMSPPETGTPDEFEDDGDGTPGTEDNPNDEDDYDFEIIPVLQSFDLAFVKRIDQTATPGPFTYGSPVTFVIEVINQGTLDATDVVVTDYIPDGLTLMAGGAWTESGGNAVLTTPISVAAGTRVPLSITFTIDLDFDSDRIDNVAEITAARNALDLPDEDSTPGDNTGDGAEEGSDDEEGDDGANGDGNPDNPDDADDFDFARVSIETVSLGSTVFLDNNNDGFQNGTDAGIASLEVQLFDATTMMQVLTDATGARVVDAADAATVVTDANGDYHFTNLLPGDYYVVIPTAPATAPISSNNTGIAFTETDPDDNRDNDDEGLQAGGSGASVSSGTVTLTLGGEPLNGANAGEESAQGNAQDDAFDSNGNMTLDFGFFAPVSVGDTAFVDLDGDGLQTLGEPGIGGVTVTLLDGNGDIVTTDADGNTITGITTTDTDGSYLFDNLPPGVYSVVFDISTADNAEFYAFTTPNAGDDADDSDNSIVLDETNAQSDPTAFLNSGEQDLTLDVGVVCNITVTVAEPFTICSTQLIDLTQDVSISPSAGLPGSLLGGSWTSSGDGSFQNALGIQLSGDPSFRFGEAVVYLPGPGDIRRGSVTLTLTTDNPAGPCEPVSNSVTIEILKVDCGQFFWDGQ